MNIVSEVLNKFYDNQKVIYIKTSNSRWIPLSEAEKIWLGFDLITTDKNKEKTITKVVGILEMLKDQLLHSIGLNSDEKDYLLRNIQSLPIPQIFGIVRNDIKVEISTNYDEIIEHISNNLKKTNMRSEYYKSQKSLLNITKEKSKQCQYSSFIFKKIIIDSNLAESMNKISGYLRDINIERGNYFLIENGIEQIINFGNI